MNFNEIDFKNLSVKYLNLSTIKLINVYKKLLFIFIKDNEMIDPNII